MSHSESSKTPITQKEFAEEIWNLCRAGSKDFISDVQPKLTEMAISLDVDRKALFIEESIILHLWVISKAFSRERGLLDEIHDCFFHWARSHNMTSQALELLRAKLEERYKRYYGAWDDNAGGDQLLLGKEVLECLLNGGRPDPKLLSAFLSVHVVTWILTFLKFALETRSQHEILGPN